MAVPPLPEGTRVRAEPLPDGLVLSWPTLTGGAGRYLLAAFLLFWLGGWAIGEAVAIWALLFSGQLGAGRLFLLFWLGGWTVGGVAVITVVAGLLRHPRPETLTLAKDHLVHEAAPVLLGLLLRRSEGNPGLGDLVGAFRRPKPVTASRESVGEIRLSTVGERQRLTFDLGAERIEVGRHLREPEREWVAQVLTAWKGDQT